MDNNNLLNQFRDMLKGKGLKITPQRETILKEISKDNGHRECEDIYLAMKQNGKNVSRATVYRTLEILVQNDFARKLELGDGRARYESKVGSLHHDHLICTSCGKIVEYMNQEIEDLQEKVAKKYGFTLDRHIHQLFGICKKCQ